MGIAIAGHHRSLVPEKKDNQAWKLKIAKVSDLTLFRSRKRLTWLSGDMCGGGWPLESSDSVTPVRCIARLPKRECLPRHLCCVRNAMCSSRCSATCTFTSWTAWMMTTRPMQMKLQTRKRRVRVTRLRDNLQVSIGTSGRLDHYYCLWPRLCLEKLEGRSQVNVLFLHFKNVSK